MGHWILAVSFIILGLTGLNVSFGKYVLMPVIGKEAFGMISIGGKYLHNYVAFAFILGLAWVFIAWIKDNFPRSADMKWALQGRRLVRQRRSSAFTQVQCRAKTDLLDGDPHRDLDLSVRLGASVPVRNPDVCQDILASSTGCIGTTYPTELSGIEEQQYAVTWHQIMAIFMICVILAHIYIGSIGMQGAFAAMGSGRVDLNWAKEHHSLWVEKLETEDKLDQQPDDAHQPDAETKAQPAE